MPVTRLPKCGSAKDLLTVVLSQPAVGVIRVRLAGELDLSTVARPRRILRASLDALAAEAAREAARDAADAPAPGRVLCDLGGLEFLAMCGVSMLVEAEQYARRRHVGFDLVAVSRPVRRTLDLVGLDERFGAASPRTTARPAAGHPAVAAAS